MKFDVQKPKGLKSHMPPRDPGAALRSASDLFQQGRLHDARRILRRLLDKDPHATGALQLAGIVASKLGTHDQAVRYLTRARDLSPSSAGAHLNLGKALQAAGRLDEAMAAFASALRLQPDNSDIHIACGGAAMEALRYGDAATHYLEAIRLAPASTDGYFNLATVLSAARNYLEAIAAWDEVRCREPGLVEPLLRISQSRQALCDWTEYDAQVDALKTVLGGRRTPNHELMSGAAFWSLVHSDDALLHLRSVSFESDPRSSTAALLARRACLSA